MMDLLYVDLLTKYKASLAEIGRCNHVQREKFMNYVSVSEEVIRDLRNKNDKLRAQLKHARDVVYSLRSSHDEYSDVLIEEYQPKELLELQNLQKKHARVGSEDVCTGYSRKRSRLQRVVAQPYNTSSQLYPSFERYSSLEGCGNGESVSSDENPSESRSLADDDVTNDEDNNQNHAYVDGDDIINDEDNTQNPAYSVGDHPEIGDNNAETEINEPVPSPSQVEASVCCIGAGYIGGLCITVLANRCSRVTITVVDIKETLVNEWNAGNIPFPEPGFQPEFVNVHNVLSSDIIAAITQAEIVFIAVDVLSTLVGSGKSETLDVANWEQVWRTIARNVVVSEKVFVEKSTLLLKTKQYIETIFKEEGIQDMIPIISNPEFFSEGTAFQDLSNLPQFVLGCDDFELYHWVPANRFVNLRNVRSAELSKVAVNASLGAKVSFVNAMATVCDVVNVDVQEVLDVLKGDPRLRNRYFSPGIGFGGRGLPKDINYLAYVAEEKGRPEV